MQAMMTEQADPSKRPIKQISVIPYDGYSHLIYALCEDGTLWMKREMYGATPDSEPWGRTSAPPA